jgi:hypothetical protein
MVKRRRAGGELVVNTGNELAVTCDEPVVNYVCTGGEPIVNLWWTLELN